MKALRMLFERAVTKQDYHHQAHPAESAFDDPVSSYYYDLRARANYSGPLVGSLPLTRYKSLQFVNPIQAAQYGIAHLQHYWDTYDDTWLVGAAHIAKELVHQGNRREDSLVWLYPLNVRGKTNWLSAMAQGQAASFLLRIGCLTGDESFITFARSALAPFFRTIEEGGVNALLHQHIWFEEYAFQPVSYTLNGYVVALLGLLDAARILNSENLAYSQLYEDGLNSLEYALPLFDANGWSRYDLTSRRTIGGVHLSNLASPFYHRFHVELLDIMFRLTGNPIYTDYHSRWSHQLQQGTRLYTAIAEKIAFRALTANPSARG